MDALHIPRASFVGHSIAGEELTRLAATHPERVDRLKAGVPMKRGGQPEEVASAILWLLSDEASYVTGSTLDVTGGR